MKLSNVIRLVAVLLVLAVFAVPVGNVSAASNTVVKFATPAETKAAVAYWTPEKMAAAKSMEVAVDYSDPATADIAAFDESAVGNPGFSSPGFANPNVQALIQSTSSSSSAAAFSVADMEADLMAGTSQVYTSYYANWGPAYQTIYPHKWIGRLFGIDGSSGFYCSGTAISNNHIVTAAHCVYDTTNNHWFTGWAFSPAYRNGSAPYGVFGWTSARILNAWINLSGSYSITGWTRYDVALISAGTSGGYTLNQKVGWAGRMWNTSYVKSMTLLGYPWQNTSLQNLPYAGLYLRLCSAESWYYTTETLGAGCNWGPGISGGPWMVYYAPIFVSGYVNSVTSGLYIGYQNLYGARFNSYNIVPLCIDDGC